MPKIKTQAAKQHAPIPCKRNPVDSYNRLCKAQILQRTDTGKYVPGNRTAPLPALFRTPAALASSMGGMGV